MNGSRRAGTNVAGSSARRTRRGMAAMAASPGKTHTGNVVQCRSVTVQTPGQMAAATSDAASRRTAGDDYAMTVPGAKTARETESAVKSESLAWIDNEMVCFCQQLRQREINYLEFVKDCPVAGIGSEPLDIIERLLSSLSGLPDCCRNFIREEKAILPNVMEKYVSIVLHSLNCTHIHLL